MNENIDLRNILKNCPKGWEFYSSIVGPVEFVELNLEEAYPVILRIEGDSDCGYTKEGWYWKEYPDCECTLFPSKDQRDWSKFTAPWYKKEKFDPKTLQPFDKVLVRDDEILKWKVDFYSHKDESKVYPDVCIDNTYVYCIPYNDETKHLVGTTDEAPEFYKYWEE